MKSLNQECHLNFIGINNSEFPLELEYGITYKEAMERILAVKNDGSVIKDINVFQEAYNTICLGWIYAPTKLTIIDRFAQFVYESWAKYRLKITFQPSIDKL